MNATTTSTPPLRRVLYHHRTQGKAVEGVHIRGITDALRAMGVAVDVVSVPGADPYASPKAMSPTQQARWWMKIVTRLPEPLFELAELAYNAVAGLRIVRYLREHDDLELIYERYSLFLFITVWLAKRRGLPIILEINDSAAVHRVRPLHLGWLARRIERWTLRNASGLVFVSGLFRDRVTQAHGHIAPSIVTPNAANIDKFSFSEAERRETRAKWGLEGHVVCGYLGAFVPWHAIDQFVYRIADRLKATPHLKLLLVGDGATFDTVAKFVHDRGLDQQILLTGRVPHDDVPGLLAAMDLAVLPSAGDYTSPVKLFEFMACGIPPIAPDFSPIQEVLVENQTGWMFKAGNLDAAVDAVIERSADRERLAEVGRNARAYIAAERQWRHNVLQLIEFKQAVTQPAALPVHAVAG
ncbi:glycosyltransferase family 4 protein [Caldimonas brevitalea]|uniref:Glycosyltransferase n=1 Tax=Caldimonas brevitalea TaxID=413882 RepID=A0A0G3BRB5_9BURK|nr:glycosyltransferase family 4 protein [Caldimonas brevitalea]AKJ29896.1 glycosyltransferase [Caldimonas brevitalea]